MIKQEKSIWARNSDGGIFITTKVQPVKGYISADSIDSDISISLPIDEFLAKFTWKYNENNYE